MNQWIFETTNMNRFLSSLSEEDRDNFTFDMRKIEWSLYLFQSYWGILTFILKVIIRTRQYEKMLLMNTNPTVFRRRTFLIRPNTPRWPMVCKRSCDPLFLFQGYQKVQKFFLGYSPIGILIYVLRALFEKSSLALLLQTKWLCRSVPFYC